MTTHARLLALALLTFAVPGGLRADAPDAVLELDPLVVVATRRDRPLSEVAGQVDVITAGDIQVGLVEHPDALFHHLPAVQAQGSGTRFGLVGFQLRGIGGNRVAIEIDGVPIRDGFAVGSYSSAGRGLIETDRIKRVEVLYGPASTLYGSDALGGVLAFTTRDPADLLAQAGGAPHLGARAAHAGANDARVIAAEGAWGTGEHGLMLSGVWRHGHERASKAATGADRQSWHGANAFARYRYDSPGGHRLRVSLEGQQLETRTQVASLLGHARFSRTTGLRGDDEDRRSQLLLDYGYASNAGLEVLARAYHAPSAIHQVTHEERAAATVPVALLREFRYEHDLSGVEMQFSRPLTGRRADHRLATGFRYLRAGVSELRSGHQRVLPDGIPSRVVLGEVMPVRDFPESRTDELGAYLQDEIQLGARWQLIPAFRYEHYRLHPIPDGIYLEDNPATIPVAIGESRINPKLGVVYQAGDHWSVYGQYVEGFRAPPFEDANIGLDIPLFRIRAVPNPDLRSERSRGLELGLRRISATTRFELAVFQTRFDDFIDSRARVGLDPRDGALLFQSRNIGHARIHGIDLRFTGALGGGGSRAQGWRLDAAAFWARGEDLDSGQPLNSMSPPQAVFTLTWAPPARTLETRLTTTLTAAQRRIDLRAGARFATPGHGIVDLTVAWQPAPDLTLNAGLFNLTDKTYWRWSDVARLAADDPMIPLLARPGRNLSVSLRQTW